MNNKSRLSIGVFATCWFMFQLVLSGCATEPFYESVPTSPVNILPQDNVDLPANTDIAFVWQESENAQFYEFHIYNQSSKDTAQYERRALSPESVCVEGRCSLTLNVRLPASEGHAWRVRAGNNAGLTDWTRTRFNMISQSIDANSDAGISTIVELDVNNIKRIDNKPELEINEANPDVKNSSELLVIANPDVANPLVANPVVANPVVASRVVVNDVNTSADKVDAIAVDATMVDYADADAENDDTVVMDANTAMDMSSISNKVVLIDAAARTDNKVKVIDDTNTLTVIDMSGLENVSENADLKERAELAEVTTTTVVNAATDARDANIIGDVPVSSEIQVSSDLQASTDIQAGGAIAISVDGDTPNAISVGDDNQPGNLKPPSLLQPVQGTSIPVGALVDFNWQAVPGAISYEFYVYDSVNKEMVESTVDLPAETLCVLQDICYVTRTVTLPPATSHAWRVRAVTENGLSPYSSGRFGVVQ